jgi:NTE family protein
MIPREPSAIARLFQPNGWRARSRRLSEVTLPGGAALYEAGDPADQIYFLRSGRLGVTRHEAGASKFLGVIRPGEVVGEMAAVSGTQHSATVTALRDSELFAMPREIFLAIARREPKVTMELASLMLERSRKGHASSGSGEPTVIGLLGVSGGVRVRALAETLALALAKLGRNTVVLGVEAQDRSAAWFSECESQHDLLILAAEVGEAGWREVAARQSDRLFLVGSATQRARDAIKAFGLEPLRRHKLVDLLLVRPAAMAAPQHGQIWRDATRPSQLFHFRETDEADIARMARVIAGRSVGLVLSGGGARAYAHLGAVRALREAGVPIDFVGGASMGAVIGAAIAMGVDDDELERRVRASFVDTSPVDDIAFPMLALSHGHKVRDRLNEHFGDVDIADLPLPFFCISADLTAGAPYVHDRGPVRDALRASVAIPGLLPPVIMDGRVLVDGAVVRNFPSDVMLERRPGVLVGLDVTRAKGLTVEQASRPPFWSWLFSGGWRRGPPIVSVLIRSATIMTLRDIEAARLASDLYIAADVDKIEIRDWKAFKPAIEVGREAAAAALASADDTLKARLGLPVRSDRFAFEDAPLELDPSVLPLRMAE